MLRYDMINDSLTDEFFYRLIDRCIKKLFYQGEIDRIFDDTSSNIAPYMQRIEYLYFEDSQQLFVLTMMLRYMNFSLRIDKSEDK